MSRFTETIVAPATGLVPAAIAVVRLSGPQALEIAAKLSGHKPFTSFRQAHLVRLRDEVGELDRCLLLPFKGPQSFTGEDVAEFHLHGGPDLLHGLRRNGLSHGLDRRLCPTGLVSGALFAQIREIHRP